MAEAKSHVVVVCGYGCHLDTPLKPYLNRVADFIKLHDPEIVVFCGGATQKKSAPGRTEAGVMSEFLDHNQKVGENAQAEFCIERDSYTTHDNIKNATSRIYKELPHPKRCRVTIFCEAQRAPSVVMLARHFMLGKVVESIDDITVETASWERADPFKQVRNLVYNKLAIKFPWLGFAEREARKRVRRSYEI